MSRILQMATRQARAMEAGRAGAGRKSLVALNHSLPVLSHSLDRAWTFWAHGLRKFWRMTRFHWSHRARGARCGGGPNRDDDLAPNADVSGSCSKLFWRCTALAVARFTGDGPDLPEDDPPDPGTDPIASVPGSAGAAAPPSAESGGSSSFFSISRAARLGGACACRAGFRRRARRRELAPDDARESRAG